MKELLQSTRQAFQKNQQNTLKQISNRAIEQAVLKDNPPLVSLSIVSYALYKLLTKAHYYKSPKWNKFRDQVDKHLKESVENTEKAEELLGKVMEDILSLDEEHNRFSQHLIDKARVKQASRAYSLGVSLETAIKLTKANRFQVYEYVGRTKIHERMPKENVSARYAHTEKVLGGD